MLKCGKCEIREKIVYVMPTELFKQPSKLIKDTIVHLQTQTVSRCVLFVPFCHLVWFAATTQIAFVNS